MSIRERVILYIVLGFILYGLVNIYCQGVPYNSNAAAFILSGLTVLVTALIGWQIYNVIAIDRRIRRLEARINLSLLRVERTNNHIEEHIHSTEQFELGMCDLTFAMLQHHRGLILSQPDRLERFCDAYIMATRSIAAILNSNRDGAIYTGLIDIAIQASEISSSEIFKDSFRPILPRYFSVRMHSICDESWSFILSNSERLSIQHLNRILDCRRLRLNFAPPNHANP